MEDIDYDETVVLTALGGPQPGTGERIEASEVGAFSLAEAVRRVVEDWPEAADRKGGFAITRGDGTVLDYAAARAIHARPDFPRASAEEEGEEPEEGAGADEGTGADAAADRPRGSRRRKMSKLAGGGWLLAGAALVAVMLWRIGGG